MGNLIEVIELISSKTELAPYCIILLLKGHFRDKGLTG